MQGLVSIFARRVMDEIGSRENVTGIFLGDEDGGLFVKIYTKGHVATHCFDKFDIHDLKSDWRELIRRWLRGVEILGYGSDLRPVEERDDN